MYWKNRETGGGANHPDEERRTNTNAELLAEIEKILASGSDTDMDVDKLEMFLAELQKRDPITDGRTAAELWKETKERNPDFFTDRRGTQRRTSRKKTGFKLLHFAEIAAVVAVCLIVSAKAFGYNPMNLLFEWADGVVNIYSGEQNNMTLPAEMPGEYRSFTEALTAYGIDSDDCPTWIPEDYFLVEISTKESKGSVRITAIYGSERGDLLMRATLYEADDWTTVVQRNEDGRVYTTAGNEYYILTNLEQMKADWFYKQCFYEISGQLSEEEIIRIVNSIPRGEVK